MIRFRFKEDEKRYLSLLSEVYRIAGSSLNHQQMSVVMRNLGKLQDILLLEGVRQGVSAAAIGVMQVERTDLYTVALRPLQLHAYIYGSHDTPLNEVEQMWLNTMEVSEEEVLDWLDPHPMDFAPETEHAALQEARRAKPAPVSEPLGGRSDLDPGDDIHVDDLLASFESDDDTFESPQSLDRIRDVLMTMSKSQIKPESWQELILRVHRGTGIDAGFIDMQLGTAMGRTVLAQAGMADIHPGPMGVDLSAVSKESAVTPLSAEDLQKRMDEESG